MPAPYPFHTHALGDEVAHSPLLNERMLDALAATWRSWPGKFWVSDVKVYHWDYDDDGVRQIPIDVEMKLHFEHKGEVWTRHMLNCCPEAHTEEALHGAIAHFLGLPEYRDHGSPGGPPA